MMSEADSTDAKQVSEIDSNSRDHYRIRSMTTSDLDAVMEIEQIIWGAECWQRDCTFRYLTNPFSKCWVLEDITTHDSIDGYGFQYVCKDESFIANLTLRPNRCGRGLGTLLLQHMIAYARQCNAPNIRLEVHTTNKRACKLYTNHGFQIVRHLPNFYSHSSDAYEMLLLF
ncbi:hypothetical protein I4U23_014363 [Adineta vaga]|nr:hypothetical protein I4U23_014363 [Adineta vaga]